MRVPEQAEIGLTVPITSEPKVTAVSPTFDRHFSCTAEISAAPERVFAHANSHARLASHMTQRSWMMGGGRMSIEADTRGGQQLGSKIRLDGRVFGVRLSVEEIVTEYSPPWRKAWQTTGSPRLLVIDHYRMGFALTARTDGTRLQVFIDYRLPRQLPARWLGRLFGAFYARWCARTMASDIVQYFSR